MQLSYFFLRDVYLHVAQPEQLYFIINQSFNSVQLTIYPSILTGIFLINEDFSKHMWANIKVNNRERFGIIMMPFSKQSE